MTRKSVAPPGERSAHAAGLALTLRAQHTTEQNASRRTERRAGGDSIPRWMPFLPNTGRFGHWKRPKSDRSGAGTNAPFSFWRDLNRVPLCSCLLRMLRNGGMDYTREAPGGCCPAALYYDRKVRSQKKNRRNSAASRIVFSMAPSPPFLSCASRIFRSMVPSPSCLCCGFFPVLFHRFFSPFLSPRRRQ